MANNTLKPVTLENFPLTVGMPDGVEHIDYYIDTARGAHMNSHDTCIARTVRMVVSGLHISFFHKTSRPQIDPDASFCPNREVHKTSLDVLTPGGTWVSAQSLYGRNVGTFEEDFERLLTNYMKAPLG